MSKFIIRGGRKLEGKLRVAANKNAVLPAMAAATLTTKEVVLENIPYIEDVRIMQQILQELGARVKQEGRTLIINGAALANTEIKRRWAQRLRASVLFLGPLLARAGQVQLAHPGGDIIGKRGIETHLEGLKNLGAKVRVHEFVYEMQIGKRTGGTIFLDEASVTGTENLMMYAALNEAETVIENAAAEPHVVCLAKLLQKMGVAVAGAGTSRISIVGRKSLNGATYALPSDFIEAGTFAIIAALTRGNLEIAPVSEADLKMIAITLARLGVELKIKQGKLWVKARKIIAPDRAVKAGPWPGFPTDLMSPFIVLATQAAGQTLCHDPMYESRMFFVDKLIRMGAKIVICDPHRVIIYGPAKLAGRRLDTPDIRAGIALVIAALIAEGESIIENAAIIGRGYEYLEKRLAGVGADIKKVK